MLEIQEFDDEGDPGDLDLNAELEQPGVLYFLVTHSS